MSKFYNFNKIYSSIGLYFIALKLKPYYKYDTIPSPPPNGYINFIYKSAHSRNTGVYIHEFI